MSEEYGALVQNRTWELVPSDPTQNLIGRKWIFCIKCFPNGSIDKLKACLVAKGFHQCPRVDYHDTSCLIDKPTTIRLILSLAVTRGWLLCQLDVNNAFFQCHLTKDVFMAQP